MTRQTPFRRMLLIVLAVLVVGACLIAGWQWFAQRKSNQGNTIAVRRGTLQAAIETTGRLTARTSRTITSSANGPVKLIVAREGDLVQPGDLLIVLDDAPAQADLQRAERARDTAETRLAVARQRAQSDEKAVPDVAAAENDVRNAQITVDDARERLAATLVVAPLAGVIGPVRVSEGSNYGAGGEITTLLSATDLYVAADIDEVDRPLITIGQAVTITVTAFPGTPLAGQIAALSATSQTRGGSTVYQAQLTFDSPTPSLALLPGMTTDVRIITTARSNVLLLPGSAIRRAGERQYVVVRRQGRDEEVAIRTGVRSGGDVEIVAGLAEGDLVVPR